MTDTTRRQFLGGAAAAAAGITLAAAGCSAGGHGAGSRQGPGGANQTGVRAAGPGITLLRPARTPIRLVSAGPVVNTGSPAFGQPVAAGHLLVALSGNNNSGTVTVTGTGWTAATGNGTGITAWYKKNSAAGEAPPVFHSPGSDNWSQLLEFSGADTAVPYLQGAAGASSGPQWTAVLPAPDSQPGYLVVAAGYWNGAHPGGSVSIARFTDSSGAALKGTLTQKSSTRGQYFATVYGIAGNTGSAPHAASLACSLYNGGQGVIVTFKPAVTVATVPSVTTSPLPGANTSYAYTSSLSASGGTPPYAWSLAAGSLPRGLSLSAAGVISGTPSAAGRYPLTVRVTDSKRVTASAALGITVLKTSPAVATLTYTNGMYGMRSWTSPVQDPVITGNVHGTPYVDSNVWGPVPGCSQAITVYDTHQWTMVANFSDPSGAVHAFPNTGWFYDKPASSYANVVGGWTNRFDHGPDIIASACWDNWWRTGIPSVPWFEMMIHFDFSNRGAGPWWAKAVPFGGYQVTTPRGPVTIPRNYWSVSYGTSGGSMPNGSWANAFWNLVDASGNILSNPGPCAVDIKAMWLWLCNNSNGNIKASWALGGFSAGYEVCHTGGVNRNFGYSNLFCHAG